MEFAITLDDAIKLHGDTPNSGLYGVRDQSVLEAVLARPCATFGGYDLYPSAVEKAACLLHGIACSHPFMDRNKRTAWACCIAFLKISDVTLDVSEDEAADYVVEVALNKHQPVEIAMWIVEHMCE